MLQSIFFLDSLQQPVPKDPTVLFLKEQFYVQTISYYERCGLLSVPALRFSLYIPAKNSTLSKRFHANVDF